MGCTVAEAQQRVSSREFAEDLGFQFVEPDGWLQVKHQIAQLTALIYNVHKAKGQDRTLTDYILDYKPRRKQSLEQMRSAVMAMAHATGARIIERGGSR